ncbi:MAG: hypothetical protein ACK4NA_07920 [Alphaproteobacteria bacterium]
MTTSDLSPRDPKSARAGLASADLSAASLSERVLAWLVPGAFLVLPIAWVIAYLAPPLNHDVAVILAIADRWLGGERMYVDLIDVNPPLIFMLNLIPAALSRVTGMDDTQALVVCVTALAAWSVHVSWRMFPALAGADAASARSQRMIFLPLALFLAIVYPGEMFAQREHIMLLAAVPYVLLAAARYEGIDEPRGRVVAIALIAGLGFALKPHFLAIPVLIELYLLTARGWRKTFSDIVPWIVLGVMAAYVAVAWIVTPEYFTSVLPLVFDSYEEIGGNHPAHVLYNRLLAPFLLMLLPLTVAAFLVPLSPLVRMTALAAIGGVVSGVMQAKGWPYHLLPAQVMTVMLAVLTVCQGIDRLLAARDRWDTARAGGAMPAALSLSPLRLAVGALMLMLFCLAGGTRSTFYDQFNFDNSQAGKLLKLVKKHAEGQPVLIVSPGIYPHFPVLNYANAKLALRFQTIWPLQGAYEACRPDEPRYHAPDQMPPMEQLLRRAVSEDFVKYRPALVIMDKNPGIRWCGGREFDLTEYFLSIPAFAEEFRNYDIVYQFDRYVLFKRKPVDAAVQEPVAGDN